MLYRGEDGEGHWVPRNKESEGVGLVGLAGVGEEEAVVKWSASIAVLAIDWV